MIRFAVVTDIHYGFDRGYRLGSKAPAAMRSFIKAANDYKPDFIVEMGDRVNAINHDEDLSWLKKLQKHFQKATSPVYSVMGNNDRRYLSNQENEVLTGCPTESYIKDIKGHRIVFWNPDVNTDKKGGLKLENEHLDWLKTQIGTTDNPVILFSHVPLDNTEEDNKESEIWDGAPFRSYYPEAEKVRRILKESGNVILCMAGHKHTNRHRQYGETHFIVHQSLIQARTKELKKSRRAYSFVEIHGDQIKIIGHGMKQPSYALQTNKKNTPDFNI